jgi:hypothetical protein
MTECLAERNVKHLATVDRKNLIALLKRTLLQGARAAVSGSVGYRDTAAQLQWNRSLLALCSDRGTIYELRVVSVIALLHGEMGHPTHFQL